MNPDPQLLPSLALLGIILFTFAAFVREWFPIDVVALVSLSLLLIFRLVTPEQAITGFSNPAVVTVMMMFVLSEALVQSGVIRFLSHRITRGAGENPWKATLPLLGLTAVLSAFINNTAAVAILMPVGIHLAKHFRFSPSKILLPISYASILGGTCTLIGTSTNLLVSALAVDHGLAAFSVFEFLRLGWILLPLGLIYNLLGPMRFLPSRSLISSLTRKYQLGAFLTEAKVPQGSHLVGRTVVSEHLSERFELNVLEILRGPRKISVDLRNTSLEPDDVLIVRGGVENILSFKEHYGLLLLSDIKLEDTDLADENNILMEVQLSPRSRLEGQTLRDIDFRRRYSCFVLALDRQGDIVQSKLADISLRRWDTLLVFGPRNRMEALLQLDDFTPLQELDIRLSLSKRWWLAPAVFAGVVALAALGVISILKAAILGAVGLLVTRRLSVQQAYSSINWTVIFLLAAILPLGLALEETGLARKLGEGIGHLAGPLGPLAALVAIFVVTSILTEMISNNAAAVLMVPIAITVAETLAVAPRPMIVAVAIAASSAFLTPMGYQTNTMVYGPGGYRFLDYVKSGAPLKLIFLVVSTLLIPLIWPF